MEGQTPINAVLTSCAGRWRRYLLALRLAGVLDWSWWWITLPLWLPIIVIVGGFAAVAMLERFRPAKS